MEQQLKFFEHEQFGKVRVVVIDDEPWFVGKDVATALGYADTFAALKQHVPVKFKCVLNAKDFKQMASQSKTGETPPLEFDSPRGLMFISEAGLYRLAMSSKMPKAQDFTDWVCSVVLVSIRKTGSYSLVVKPEKVVNPNRRAGQLKDAGVYAALMDNNTVKIGQTCDIAKRLSNLQTQYKFKVVEYHYTPLMTREVARAIEKACHEIFSPSKVDGEFFCVEFSAACRLIDSFVKFSVTVTTSKIAVVAINQIVAEKFD